MDQSTVLNVLATAGEHCARLLDSKIRDLKSEQVAIDELWSFVYCKESNREEFKDGHGDQYVFLAIDKDSKLVLSHLVGRRTNENCYWFIRDIQGRIPNRFQLSSDSWGGYTGKGGQLGAVEKVFGENGVDYGTERLNLSARLFNRRFTRLTVGYSKNIENHRHALALFVAHYNFCRTHGALKEKGSPEKTPAQAAGLTDHVWTVEELLTEKL